MATILVTGANRGIGLELCRQFAARGDDVIAACRKSSPELDVLPVRIIDGIDVGDGGSIARLQEALGEESIDVLVNNAGILRSDSLNDLDFAAMEEQFRINTLGPLRVSTALLANLAPGSKIAIVTSRMGSIADNASGGYYGYRASKTAVNQVAMSLKHDLGSRGIAVAVLHPGMVATGMTGGHGVSAASAAAGLINRIDALDLQSSGSFWHAEGYELPW